MFRGPSKNLNGVFDFLSKLRMLLAVPAVASSAARQLRRRLWWLQRLRQRPVQRHPLHGDHGPHCAAPRAAAGATCAPAHSGAGVRRGRRHHPSVRARRGATAARAARPPAPPAAGVCESAWVRMAGCFRVRERASKRTRIARPSAIDAGLALVLEPVRTRGTCTILYIILFYMHRVIHEIRFELGCIELACHNLYAANA